MVERSRCCWYDVVGAWWKPRRAERFFEELQLDTIHSAHCLAQASDRIRSAGRSSCENMRLLTRMCLSRGYAPSLGVSIILRSGTKSTASWVPASTSSHPILTLMLWRGPSVLLKLTEMPWYWRAEQYIAQSLPGLPTTPPILSSPAKVVDLLLQADRSRQSHAVSTREHVCSGRPYGLRDGYPTRFKAILMSKHAVPGSHTLS